MTLKDIFVEPEALITIISSMYVNNTLSNNADYSKFLSNYLLRDFVTDLRFETKDAFTSLSKWTLKALDYQNEYEKYVSAIRLNDDSDRTITKYTGKSERSGDNRSESEDISEGAANPSQNTSKVLDPLPYVTGQQRGKYYTDGYSTGETNYDNTTEMGELYFTEKLVGINPPQLIALFDRHMRYIFKATV